MNFFGGTIMSYPKTFILCLLLPLFFVSCSKPVADLILKNGEIYTMEEDLPWANTIVIAGNKIISVLQDQKEADNFIGSTTKIIDLKGTFVVPGFIDAHTHMDGFGAQQNDIDLIPVSDALGLRKELQRVVDILGPKEWITKGRWGGKKIWETDWREREKLKKDRWEPDRWLIDDITRDNPCFLCSYDKELFLANSAALKAAKLEDGSLPGMKVDKNNKPTGLIYAGSPAIKKIESVIKPKSEERIMKEIQAAIYVMNKRGITEVHDIVSEEMMHRYSKLQKEGKLTLRIWGRPHIIHSQSFKERNIKMGTHPVTGLPDNLLRYGGFKGYYDGFLGSHTALLFAPYDDKPESLGGYRNDSSDDPKKLKKSPDKYFNFMKIGFEQGFSTDTHAIGSRAVSEIIDEYQRLVKLSGKLLNRFRVIHAEIVMPKDFERFLKLNLIAEVNPSQMDDDMRWIKDRLGPVREKMVFPFKTFLDKGVKIIFGSDVPGNAGANFSNHPALAIHAAVHRTRRDGSPEGGWIPEQKISVHEAIKAFTINGAYGVFDENIRGSLKEGKLADITVCSVNIVKNHGGCE